VRRVKRDGSRVPVFFIASLLLITEPVLSYAAEIPQTVDPAKSCASGECHSAVGTGSHAHWPDFGEAGECQKCHQPQGDSHLFVIDDPPDLCVECHEEIGEKIGSATTVHDPAEDCTDCHDPHGGEVRSLLLGVTDGDDLKPLCFECHDEDLVKEAYTHDPAAQGECTVCHDPHGSSQPSLLVAEGIELCGDCHDDVAELVEESENVHSPVEDGCTECHNPHSGPYPKMLPAKKRQICNECHDDIVEVAENATVDHAPTVSKRECLNCHSPHASNHESNLLKPQPDLCLGCHNKPVESGDSTLADMQGWLLQNKGWHEPIREEGCARCHEPHGGENFRLLREPFPRRFYAAFAPEVYGLCFSCHEDGAFTVERTRTLTGFRDGERNLHFVHVNKKKRGRTCRACHDLHASRVPHLLSQKVPYGKWMMPLNFVGTETGGSCRAGCHKIRAYDREAGKSTGAP
jgi:predicted CXXCH cytochrome family protein